MQSNKEGPSLHFTHCHLLCTLKIHRGAFVVCLIYAFDKPHKEVCNDAFRYSSKCWSSTRSQHCFASEVMQMSWILFFFFYSLG